MYCSTWWWWWCWGLLVFASLVAGSLSPPIGTLCGSLHPSFPSPPSPDYRHGVNRGDLSLHLGDGCHGCRPSHPEGGRGTAMEVAVRVDGMAGMAVGRSTHACSLRSSSSSRDDGWGMTVRTAAWATDMLSSLPAVVTAAVGFLLGWSEARLPVQPPFSRLGEVRLVQMAAAAAADPGLAPGPVPWDPTTNDATQKDDSSLRLWEVSRQDYAHAPVPYALALQSLAGLRLNTVTGRGVEMRASERRALRQHLGPHAADLSPGGAGGADAPAAPQKRLQGFIQGDHLHYTFGIGEITDQHASKSAIPPAFREALCDDFIQLLHVPNMPRPLVVDVFDLHVGFFALQCLYRREEELRTATRRFVLTTLEEDGTAAISFFTHPEIRKHRNVNLTYLLEHPLLAHWYAVNGNVQHPKFTALPIGMLFYHNSGRHLLNKGLSTSRYAEEEMEREVTRVFLQQMDLNQIFPHIAHPLKLGRAGCLWVEKAMDIFRIDDEWQGERSGPPRSVHPTWVPISELPATVTTIYVVLMPIYLASEPDSGFHPPPPSLTHHVLVFPPTASRVDDPTDKKEASDEWDSWSLPLAHSFSPPSSLPSPTVPLRATVAFLPFTAAVLHRLRQVPYGDSSKKHSVAVGFQRYAWRDRWLHYLTSHPELVVHPKTKEKLSYYTLLSDTAFTAAPVGYGYECYRYWEALILGSIPLLDNPVTAVRKIKGNTFRNPIASSAELAFPGGIVSPAALKTVYDGLPVVFIDNVEDITEKNLQRWREEANNKMKKGEYRLEKLFAQYWVDKIFSHEPYRTVR